MVRQERWSHSTCVGNAQSIISINQLYDILRFNSAVVWFNSAVFGLLAGLR